VPTATPTPEPASARENVEVEPDGGEKVEKKRRGFFSFLSRKSDRRDDAGEEDKPDQEVGTAGAEDSETDGEKDPSGDGNGDGLRPGEEIERVYRLKAGDRVYITLSGSGGLSEQVETVIDDEGAVKLRYIGSVKASGRSTTELEDEIEAEYTDRQKIYKEVVARVVVPNTFYFIGGEVRQPGRFPLMGRVTLSQAIPSAGNFTEWANKGKIILARGDERFVIDFREIADDPTRDVELQPGDVITVERRSFL
jgi:polysaccharide export outer membrane protein